MQVPVRHGLDEQPRETISQSEPWKKRKQLLIENLG
jgi:hypothetical protein